jgi:predicted Zn-dependent peptidase
VAGLVVGLLTLASGAALAAPPSRPARAGAPKKGKGAKVAVPRAAPAVLPPRAAAAPPAPLEIKLDVRRATFANGLRVVVDVDHTSPTVAVAVAYDVGARNEERGRSGFAHLFEHLMFQGSRNVPRGDHFRLISGHGGVLNGTTNADRTNYFEVLPESELALALWLEADRMRSLDVSQSNFENQRQVVQEEYRMRVSNAAYAPSKIRLEELVYQGYWPYEHPTIGSMTDLDGAKVEWVQAFHAGHYGPNNAVLSIAGDVDPDAAMALAHRYFDDVAPVTVAPFADPGLPEQTSQRTAMVKDDHARTPGVLLGWAVPPARSADHYAVDLAAAVLADGESSRLHQLLVRDKGLAQSVSAGAEQRRGPDLLRVEAVLSPGAKPAQVEALIEAEIDALATRGPTDAELAKAQRRVEASFVLGLSGNMARASELAEYELYFGDARLLSGELPRYLAVTRDDVKRVAAQYLGPTRRTVVETYPSQSDDEKAPRPAARAVAAPPAHAAAPKKSAAKPKKQKRP